MDRVFLYSVLYLYVKQLFHSLYCDVHTQVLAMLTANVDGVTMTVRFTVETRIKYLV